MTKPAHFLSPIIKDIALNDIEFSNLNPRRVKAEDRSTVSLKDSIVQCGQLVPVIVRQRNIGKYELLAGNRRFVAMTLIGSKTIRSEIVTADDQQALVIITTENLQREDLTPFEEAEQLKGLLDRFEGDAKAVAAELGRSASWVARRARLLNLSPNWQDAIKNGKLNVHWSAGHLELIARYDIDRQNELFEEMGHIRGNYLITVRDLADRLNDSMSLLRKAPFKPDDDTLVPEIGACTNCPKRSGCQPLLFEPEEISVDDLKKNDKCLDNNCWESKAKVQLERQIIKHKEQYPNLVQISDEYSYRDDGVITKGLYETVKKSDPGALPAIQVDGAGIGKLRWIKTNQSAKQATKAAAKESSGKNKAAAIDWEIEDKTKRLDGRRAAWIIQEIVKLFESDQLNTPNRLKLKEDTPANKYFPALVDIGDVAFPRWIFPRPSADKDDDPDSELRIVIGMAAIAATFGTQNKYDSEADEDWLFLDKLTTLHPTDIVLELWKTVAPIFIRRLFFSTNESALEKLPEAERICGIIGVDFADLKKKSEAEIHMPKSLQALLAVKAEKKQLVKAEKTVNKKTKSEKAAGNEATEKQNKAEKIADKPSQKLKPTSRKLDEIAEELSDVADEVALKNNHTDFTFHRAFKEGRKIKVIYNHLIPDSFDLLSANDAEKYLAWLNAGNIGRYRDMP